MDIKHGYMRINLTLGNPRAQCPRVLLVFWILGMGILVASVFPLGLGGRYQKCPV